MDNGTAIKFNWHRFWTKATGIRRQSAHVGQFGNPDLLGRFFEETGMPDDFAAFGCGPADGPWELASRYPDLSVFGYDIAESAIETAKTSADAPELSNVSFAVDSPKPLDRSFDIVYCYATLHYIEEIETPIQALYDRTRADGYLIFNYPNRYTLAVNRRILRGDADRPLPLEPADCRDRFAHVFEEANLHTYDHIEEILGTRPRRFWSRVKAQTNHGLVATIPAYILHADRHFP